ncbi:hypothetical protein ILUMI_23656 [Ignelater luminosus]|uniref:Uncharacterized protein n=1 Tax=Ignelater luminosus TaxID=2038154 RepID=A0A8K0CEX8_IGNLU|nr:hypothetical protein ILUMI_23656 [Ignelater luminosus]
MPKRNHKLLMHQSKRHKNRNISSCLTASTTYLPNVSENSQGLSTQVEENDCSPLQSVLDKPVYVSDDSSHDSSSYESMEHDMTIDNELMINRTSNPQYTKVIYPQCTIALFENDNCVQLKNGSICIIENITASTENTVIIGKQFLEMRDFFSKPYKSSIVGIYKVSQLSNERQIWHLENIAHKVMKLPIDDILLNHQMDIDLPTTSTSFQGVTPNHHEHQCVAELQNYKFKYKWHMFCVDQMNRMERSIQQIKFNVKESLEMLQGLLKQQHPPNNFGKS